MMSRTQPSLPANRAFVVQLHADAQPERGDFKGRVEHLVSEVDHFQVIQSSCRPRLRLYLPLGLQPQQRDRRQWGTVTQKTA